MVVDDAEDCLATCWRSRFRRFPASWCAPHERREEALDLLAAQPVDAVITDIHLPAMNGLEFIARIRRDPALRRLPVIVVSGDANPAGRRLALESGADAYFAKPFSPAAVRKKLEELIHAR